MSLTLSHHKKAATSILQDVEVYPSVSWMAAASVEGFNNFSQIIESGRLKSELFKDFSNQNLTCWRCDGAIDHPMNEGMAAKYKAGGKFNDHWECKGKHNAIPVVCAACELLADRTYHPNFKLNALYTGKEAFQLTLDEDLISFLFTPPPSPYLFVMAEKNSQHMVWLSDYTLDSDLISIQKARDRFLVSRSEAFVIAGQYKKILTLTNEIRLELGNKVGLATPLESTRREINTRTSNNMQLSSSIYSTARHWDNDSAELREKRIELQGLIHTIDTCFMTYGTWYVASMFLKAIITDFEIKPSSQWQKIIKK
jgi:CRISPR type IV-associated protein Csf1